MKAKALRELGLCLLIGVPLLGVACSEETPSLRGDADDDRGDGDDESPIKEAPASWAAPSDCLGVGNCCAADGRGRGCQAPDSTCLLGGDVCIPAAEGRSRSVKTPYCTASICMTYEEASCYCLGEAGMSDADCASPSQFAHLCEESTSPCDEPIDSGNECNGVRCRSGETCVNSDVEAFAGCQETCRTDDGCSSGCCKLFSSGSSGFCANAPYCSCVDIGDPCGTPGIGCCDEAVCVGSSGNYACKVSCQNDDDCGTDCCYPLADGITLVCEAC